MDTYNIGSIQISVTFYVFKIHFHWALFPWFRDEATQFHFCVHQTTLEILSSSQIKDSVFQFSAHCKYLISADFHKLHFPSESFNAS